MSKEEPVIRVLITGAASPRAYALAGLVANGMALGSKQPMIFHLFDVPNETGKMEGLMMELIDSAFPLLREVITTCDPVVAFQDISVAFLLDAKTRPYDMTQRDLIVFNAKTFKDHGLCLENFARKDCKVIVLAYPGNTMCYICAEHAPSIPRENFTANTRLNHNRTIGHLAYKYKMPPVNFRNVIVWGNQSQSMYTDCSIASVVVGNKSNRIFEYMPDEIAYLKTQLAEQIANRGTDIIAARKLPSELSSAKAACDQLRDWIVGTPHGTIVSMTVSSDGSYGTPKELFFSLPVEIIRGKWSIVRGIKLDELARNKIDTNAKELLQEKMQAITELGDT
ncbi:uncharacterized protein LOC128863351 [Anastrepha ludens]|uniref:uncharacterized protein LOC128863351 n=1 Tax=Anastrepha ludens TaxID=28586 RepID=UPI0023B169E7|nr:uncharacterized protein LOC128863351 [Anastrepha ludens]